jgi:hypothetical protein
VTRAEGSYELDATTNGEYQVYAGHDADSGQQVHELTVIEKDFMDVALNVVLPTRAVVISR